MASADKSTHELARQLLKLSFDQGRLSAERVAGVLEYVEKNEGTGALATLKAYRRLVEAEVAREQAVVEHAGGLSAGTLQSIAEAMSQKYQRPITAVAQPNPSLIAGLRVRIGDDIYESSVAGQLAGLAATV